MPAIARRAAEGEKLSYTVYILRSLAYPEQIYTGKTRNL